MTKKACLNSGQDIHDHFVRMHEMVKVDSGTSREIEGIIKSWLKNLKLLLWKYKSV
ncbi:MAG: hypothetical protein P4L35_03610 [Ignavibacteriaceae bacterium]|nr:hypothetical protein [Ignavibacteriaceae bacterium]